MIHPAFLDATVPFICPLALGLPEYIRSQWTLEKEFYLNDQEDEAACPLIFLPEIYKLVNSFLYSMSEVCFLLL